jgi:hypothetical protein
MRVQQTPSLELFYPEGQEAAVEPIRERLEQCFAAIDPLLKVPRGATPARVILHRGEQNNAYVSPSAMGRPPFMVLPLHEGIEWFNLVNLGLVDVGHISCHEAIHYATFLQYTGPWRTVHDFFGDVLSPQVFLDSWLHEGMATYYESRLAGPIGRPQSLLWRGLFESFVAGRGGRLQPGDLSVGQRELAGVGGHYLVGMHFVEYLANTYGEDKLWELIARQGRALWVPFFVSMRFHAVYGKTLGVLFDEWAGVVARQPMPPPVQPKTIRVPNLGFSARLASCPAQGLLATVHSGPDDVPRLSLFGSNGEPRWSRRLIDILPPRRSLSLGPQTVSGLSFTADCRWLYWIGADAAADTSYQTSLWQTDVATGTPQPPLYLPRAVGGSVDPAGKRYAYVALEGGSASLKVRDLQTGATWDAPAVPGATSLGGVGFSGDGQRLGFSARTAQGFNLYEFSDVGGVGELRTVTADDKGNYGYARAGGEDAPILTIGGGDSVGESGRRRPVIRWIYPDGSTRTAAVSYAALDAKPGKGGEVVYLDLEGVSWSVSLAQPAKSFLPAVSPALPAKALLSATPTSLKDLSAQPPDRQPAKPADPNDLSASPTDLLQTNAKPISLPYRATKYALYPTLRFPYFRTLLRTNTAGRPLEGYEWGAYFKGQDSLGYHTYGIDLSYSSLFGMPSIGLTYLNATQAPWSLLGAASLRTERHTLNWALTAAASRPWYTSSVLFGLQALRRDVNPLHAPPTEVLQMLGPLMRLSYQATESTAYAGVLRGLSTGLQAAVYPAALSSTDDLFDLGLGVAGAVPLPFSKRHSLRAALRGRQLFGDRVGRLQLGGPTSGTQVAYQTPLGVLEARPNSTLDRFGGQLGLAESQRGFEDAVWLGSRVALGQVAYHYPLIIDIGWMSVLNVLPSLFIQQVDLELWGSTSTSQAGTVAPIRSHAAGLSASLRTLWGSTTSLQLSYQIGVRQPDVGGAASLHHLITLSP